MDNLNNPNNQNPVNGNDDPQINNPTPENSAEFNPPRQDDAQSYQAAQQNIPPQQPYQQPVQPNYNSYNQGQYSNGPVPPYPPTQQGQGHGMAIASLVLGIVGIVFGCCLWYITIPCAIIGLILGVMANKQEKNGMATAGIVLSSISLALAVIELIMVIAAGTSSVWSASLFEEVFPEFSYYS